MVGGTALSLCQMAYHIQRIQPTTIAFQLGQIPGWQNLRLIAPECNGTTDLQLHRGFSTYHYSDPKLRNKMESDNVR